MTRLHLGCGTRYLNGYINIDYPPSEHTVQNKLVADIYADITGLHYPASSIDEIRLHHVFEHFPRQVALALLCRWADWLKPSGLLRIETPDLMRCAWGLLSPLTGYRRKQQMIRQLFGSHEAAWAVHWDGWYKERFKVTLGMLGFEQQKFTNSKWEVLYNLEVTATRDKRTFDVCEYERIVEKLLRESLITHRSSDSSDNIAESELTMLAVWLREWRNVYTNQGTA